MIRFLLPALLIVASSIALAQDKPKGVDEFNEFNAKPLEGWVWDEDERLQDLVEQLQQKELTLQAIDAAIAKAMGKKVGAKMAANMAWRSTQRMDLNGGGPIRWDAFYGRNAESFFYHPKDPNTTYHTNTVLQQVASPTAGGVPGNQGVPAHQRPPQFDYIYRGYEQSQARAQAEAKQLADKIDDMKSRRRQLEEEVVVLWMKLAFRVIDRDKLPEHPTLRFAFMPKAGDQANADEQALALTSATRLLAAAMLFNEERVEQTNGYIFNDVSSAVKENRKAFEDGVFRLASLQADGDNKDRPLGQFKFLARKLEDTAKSLSEGYRGWQDGDKNDDEQTKFNGLKRIQDGVVRYSKLLLALNELVGQMKKQWAVELNTDGPEFTPQWEVSLVPPIPLPKQPPVEPQKGFVPVRITYHYAADGKTTTTVRRIEANASDGPSQSKKKIAPGIWRFTHVFRDESSLGTVGGPIRLDRGEGRVELDSRKKALIFPAGVNAGFQYPVLFLALPIAVELDVLANIDEASVQIGVPDTCHLSQPFVIIKTQNGFRTVDIQEMWVVKQAPDSPAPEMREVAVKRNAPTDTEIVCSGLAPAPPKPKCFYWPALACHDRAGFSVLRLAIEGKVGPRIGVELKAENGVVVANVFPGPAEQAGVQKGDRIQSIAGRRPASLENAMELISATDYGDIWKLEVERDGSKRAIAIRNP